MKTNKQGIGRREFIVMTSATAVAALAMGDTLLKSAPAAAAAGARFAIGFVDFGRLARQGQRFAPNAVSVNAVPSADGLFIRNGVRLAVRGYNVTPKAMNARNDMALTVNYPAADGQHVYPYTAWSYSKKSGGGSPVSFAVPVSNDQHIRLLFSTDLSTAAAAATQSTGAGPSAVSRRDMLAAVNSQNIESSADPDAITLTLNSEPGLPKLRRGFYIIAPLGAGTTEPDWISLQLRKTEAGYKLFSPDGSTGSPATFEYLVLLADYQTVEADDPTRPEKNHRQ
jgi:hypothetical protein